MSKVITGAYNAAFEALLDPITGLYGVHSKPKTVQESVSGITLLKMYLLHAESDSGKAVALSAGPRSVALIERVARLKRFLSSTSKRFELSNSVGEEETSTVQSRITSKFSISRCRPRNSFLGVCLRGFEVREVRCAH